MVKIIVLVKQVVQSAELKVDRTTKTLVTQGVPQVIHVGLSGQKVSPRLYSACGISADSAFCTNKKQPDSSGD